MSIPTGSLAVSLHDVAPQTWPACQRLLQTIERVAPVPVTLLVVPDYHGEGLRHESRAYRCALDARLERGDELALHGWFHADRAALDGGLIDTLRRTRLTAREGEFAALAPVAAHALIERGCQWFEQRGWPLHGFVAPAWLPGPGTWEALAHFSFQYTTTLGQIHLLPERTPVATRTLVYSVRSALRRRLSLVRNAALATMEDARPVRLALHPADAAHDAVMQQVHAILRGLTRKRSAMTNAQLAGALRLAGSAGQRGRAA